MVRYQPRVSSTSSRTPLPRTTPNRFPEQNRREQNRTKQNRTKQNKTKQNNKKTKPTNNNNNNSNTNTHTQQGHQTHHSPEHLQCLLGSTAEATHLPLCYALTSSDLGRGHCGQIPYSHAHNDLANTKGELWTNFLISSLQGANTLALSRNSAISRKSRGHCPPQ